MIQEKNSNVIDNLVQYLLENELAFCGAPLASTKFKLLRHNLKNSYLSVLPEIYWEFLTKINGVFLDGTEIYGLAPEIKLIKDVEQINKTINNSQIIFLGENETDWFCYDVDAEEFQVLDKTDQFIWKHSDSLESVLAYFLKL